jgi:hypothetical protein
MTDEEAKQLKPGDTVYYKHFSMDCTVEKVLQDYEDLVERRHDIVVQLEEGGTIVYPKDLEKR